MKHFRITFAFLPAMGMAYASSAAEEGAIPQMDFASFPNQMLWLAICFTLFYIIVSRVIIPSVDGVLANRKTTIAEAIAAAEDFKKNAAEARGEFEHRTQEVHEKVAAMTAKALADATASTHETMAKLNVELEAKTQGAARNLAQSLERAKPDMQAATADVARAIAEQLLGVKVDASVVANATKHAA